jgi:hypothetical protein
MGLMDEVQVTDHVVLHGGPCEGRHELPGGTTAKKLSVVHIDNPSDPRWYCEYIPRKGQTGFHYRGTSPKSRYLTELARE